MRGQGWTELAKEAPGFISDLVPPPPPPPGRNLQRKSCLSLLQTFRSHYLPESSNKSSTAVRLLQKQTNLRILFVE